MSGSSLAVTLPLALLAVLATVAFWRVLARVSPPDAQPGPPSQRAHENHEKQPTVPVWVSFSCGHSSLLQVPAAQARDRAISARCGCRFRGYPVSVKQDEAA